MKKFWWALSFLLLVGVGSLALAETEVTLTYTDQIVNAESDFSHASALMNALGRHTGKQVRVVLKKPLNFSGQTFTVSGPKQVIFSGEALTADKLELHTAVLLDGLTVTADQVAANGHAFTLGEGAVLSGNRQGARVFGAADGTDADLTIAGTVYGTVYGGSTSGIAGRTSIRVEKTGVLHGNLFGGGYLTADGLTGGVNSVSIQIDGRVTAREGAGQPTGLVFAGGFVRGRGAGDQLLGDSVITVSGLVEGSIYGGGNVAGGAGGDRASGYHRGKSEIRVTGTGKVMPLTQGQYALVGGGWANQRADVINDQVYMVVEEGAQVGNVLGGGYADGDGNNVSDVNTVVMEIDGRVATVYAGGAAVEKSGQAKVNGGGSIRFGGEGMGLVGTGVSVDGSDAGILSGGAKLVLTGGTVETITGFSGIVVSKGSTTALTGSQFNQEGKITVKGAVQFSQPEVTAGEVVLEKGKLLLPAGGQFTARQLSGSGRIALPEGSRPDGLRIAGLSSQADITLAMDGYALSSAEGTAVAVPISEKGEPTQTPTDEAGTPPTGDPAQLALLVCLLCASAACILLVIRKGRHE